jgi:hypothetical protein
MAVFNKDKLTMVSQGVAGLRMWRYSDTGLLIADVSEVSGFFTTGWDCGMRKGDVVVITEGDTGTADNLPMNRGGNTGGHRQYIATILSIVDTGATQVTLGLPVLVGDTS